MSATQARPHGFAPAAVLWALPAGPCTPHDKPDPIRVQVWRLNMGHVLVAQEAGKLGEAAELYESLVQHFAGGPSPGGAAAPAGPAAIGGSLLDVPPSALANLCVCHVIGGRNEVAEDLLRRLEEEIAATAGGDSMAAGHDGAAAAGGAAPGTVPRHLSLANLAIGTLYCAKGGCGTGWQAGLLVRGRHITKTAAYLPAGLGPRVLMLVSSPPSVTSGSAGNFEFGITRVMRSLEPLATHLDAPRWHTTMLCLVAMLDQASTLLEQQPSRRLNWPSRAVRQAVVVAISRCHLPASLCSICAA